MLILQIDIVISLFLNQRSLYFLLKECQSNLTLPQESPVLKRWKVKKIDKKIL